jgi:4-diphosphocytidyl-2-C-methyl-D-erythritol kinase
VGIERAPGAASAWPAPAKLNLFLHVVGQRPDGYHLLQTAFQLLDWCDRVELAVRDDGRIVRVQGPDGVPAEADLSVRAARALKAATGSRLGATIAVDKRLPLGGGVGGGSSDAATVLVALNALWGTGLDDDALAGLGLRLGADVPVFVRGRSSWAEGVGDALVPIELPARWFVVVDPHEAVATGPIFQAPELTRDSAPTTIPRFLAGEATRNDLEPVVRARYRRVARALEWLDTRAPARLTGSGGCVFAAFASEHEAREVAAACPDEFAAEVARGVSESPLRRALEAWRRKP